jgi:hypothetical protein
MDYSVWFRGVEIGTVTLERVENDVAYAGPLHPTPVYWEHRAELQTLTLGVVALQGDSPSHIAETVRAAFDKIRAGNLELRTDSGAAVPGASIVIADYAPAELPTILRGALPIAVCVRF